MSQAYMNANGDLCTASCCHESDFVQRKLSRNIQQVTFLVNTMIVTLAQRYMHENRLK